MKYINLKRFIHISILLILTSELVTSYKPPIKNNASLYKPSDGVDILNADNMESMLYGNNKPWFIQFYYSTCGHCRSYLPHFKKFLRNVSRWRSVINLGVINCIVELNMAVCRRWHQNKAPRLSYYHENLNKSNNAGIRILGPDSAHPDVATRENLLKVLIDEQKRGRFKNGPCLKKRMLKSASDIFPFTFVIFEDIASNVGAQVVLDTNEHNKAYAIVIGLSDSPLAKDIGIRQFPALVLQTSTNIFINLTPEIPNRENIVKIIDKYTFDGVSPTTPTTDLPTTTPVIKPVIVSDNVLLDDLEASLETMLHTELVIPEFINGHQYDALMNLLAILHDYFPFRANGKAFMRDLRNSLLKQRNITGQNLETLIHNLTKKNEPVWATPALFVKCLGSSDYYRGYTCGVWQIFHTMTVLAARSDRPKSQTVLNVMYGYMKNFFGCEDCSKHFQKMAEDLNLHEPKNNKDAVMWLWKAHNIVNKRLSGQESDDPMYPKKQFPVEQNCRSCQQNGSYDLDIVYDHLTKIYSEIGVNGSTYFVNHQS